MALHHAAVELFERQGYAGTTVDDIVRLANCSRITFFRYFGSKEDAAFGDVPERVAAIGDRLDRSRGVDPVREVRRVLTAETLHRISVAGDQPKTLRLWFAEPTLERRYVQILSSVEDTLTEYLVSMWDDGNTSLQIEARVLATAMISVPLAVVRSDIWDPTETYRALDRGYDLLERGAEVVVRERQAHSPHESALAGPEATVRGSNGMSR